MSLVDDIKQKALEIGFDLVGITDSRPIDARQTEVFADWLGCGYAGQMSYMHRNLQKRINPAALLENAKSVICLGLNYTPPKAAATPSEPAAAAGRVAAYAQYEDYHHFMKKQLHELVEFIISITGKNIRFKVCVDSAPLAERALAARAGLGFIGKNHMLISPEFGPQILLGEIVTDLELQADEPLTDSCSGCDRCLAACPTGALRPDGWFDADRCISYLTVEHKDLIPPELAEKVGDWLFGCDECVMVCPWRKDAPVCGNRRFRFHPQRSRLELRRLLGLSVESFETEFADSCLKRTGLERLKRNAQVCLANTAGLKG